MEIEQHADIDKGDPEDLYEITHITVDNIEELIYHLDTSAVAMSQEFTNLYVRLKKILSIYA